MVSKAARRGGNKKQKSGSIQALQEEIARLRSGGGSGSNFPPPPAPFQGKGGGRNKGGGKGSGPRLPPALIGKDLKTPDGRNICFGFNLPEGCRNAEPGKSCPRGAHVCCEPGCYKAHSLCQHR